MRLSSLFYLHRSDRQVLLAFLLVAVVVLSGLFLMGDEDTDEVASAESEQASDSLLTGMKEKRAETEAGTERGRRVERFAFDPNTADSSQLRRLGLKDWQIRNIYKYRASGGIYRQKDDFARTYGLTQKEYRELEPYITIGADYQPAALLIKERQKEKVTGQDSLLFPKKISEGTTVSLAIADTTQLKTVPGIGSYFARKIVDYRQQLGGFVSIDQLDEIEGFPLKAKAYLRLDTITVKRLNLNKLSVSELRRHPYLNYYQARAIVDYRRLHGKLKSLDELRLLRDFPSEALQRLEPYVEF